MPALFCTNNNNNNNKPLLVTLKRNIKCNNTSLINYFILLFTTLILILHSANNEEKYLNSLIKFTNFKVECIEEVKIGALLKEKRHEIILRKNIDSINDDKTLLTNVKLTLIVELIDNANSFEVSASICRLLAKKVWLVIGPHSIQLTPIIQSLTSYYKIPLLLTSWQPAISFSRINNNNNKATNVAFNQQQQRSNQHQNQPPSSLSSEDETRSIIDSTFINNNKRRERSFDSTKIISRRLSEDFSLESVPAIYNFTINLYPQSDRLSQAYLDLVKYKNWKTFTLIYDSAENFVRLKDVLQASFSDALISIHKLSDDLLQIQNSSSSSSSSSSLLLQSSSSAGNEVKSQLSISTLQANGELESQAQNVGESLLLGADEHCSFDSNNNNNNNDDNLDTNNNRNIAYGKLMKDLRMHGAENIILSLPLDKVCKLLREAKLEQLLTIYNDYIIANLDSHLLQLEELSIPALTNISSFSLLDPAGVQTDFTVSKKWLGKKQPNKPKRRLSSEYALFSDALTLVAHALDELISVKALTESKLGILEPNLDCKSADSWDYGETLIDLLKGTTRSGGYTGDLRFDKFGQRLNFELEFLMHKNNSFKKVGVWNITNELKDLSKQEEDYGLQALKNKTLKVVVAMTEPYVMYKDNYTDYIGNDKYHGYCIDLLNKLAKKLMFKFDIKEVSDGQYGKIQNGTWTGMIKELLDGKADLAIVDLTITKERQSAVDFTHPFMTLGIAIMFKKPKVEKAELFSFLMPFSTEVWLSMGSASFGSVLTMWIISRLSPLEWTNPHPCDDETDEQDYENELHSVGASLWFIIGSLMQQGSDLAPRSTSVRALASVWYFFTLILISSYTANFAAFLTASRMQSPIESAEDLSKQTKIDYGCKEGGATQAYFASSNHSTYRRMWNFMESRKHQGVFTPDNAKGIQMVKNRNFAFLMESTSIEYVAQRDCEITQIGGLLDHKGYGIALRKRSPFREPFSKAIVELNEAGELQDLKNRWWIKDSSQSGTSCVEQKDSALATSELGIDKVGGVFVLLGLGVCFSSAAVVLEFVWKSLKIAKDERKPIKVMLWNEVLRIFMCGPSKRPNANSIYDKSNSHVSSTNIADSIQAPSLARTNTYDGGLYNNSNNNNSNNNNIVNRNLGIDSKQQSLY